MAANALPREQFEPKLVVLPRILCFGRAGCKRCDSAKKKLGDYFHLPYEFIDVNDPPADWRATDAVEVLADACVRNIDFNHPPIIGIDGVAYEYADAMKALKQRSESCQMQPQNQATASM
jgi:hypothetical protein